jgi:hypothetical protein
MATVAQSQSHEPHPNPQALASNPPHNTSSSVDYEPHPGKSIDLDEGRQKIVDSICGLYSGSASEEDMQVCLVIIYVQKLPLGFWS